MLKENNKKLLVIIALILSLFLVTGCDKEEEKSDAVKFKEEYESINGKFDDDKQIIRNLSVDEDNPFIYSTAEEIINKIENDESFLVYFGYAKDARSRCIIETLINTAKEERLKQIYYVDISTIRNRMSVDKNGNLITLEKGSDGYNKLLELLEDHLYDYQLVNNYGESVTATGKRIYAPTVISIIKGEFNSLQDGISPNLVDLYGELNDTITNYSKERFSSQIKILVEELESCSVSEGC